MATPEENAIIEAYHSLIEYSIEQRYEFELIYEANLVLNRWKLCKMKAASMEA